MAYRYDPDLEFLGNCSSEELKDFAELLIYNKDGNERVTGNSDLAKKYKEQPDCNQYWQELAAEFQKFGGNTIANYVGRFGDGVLYREILCDVCDKLKVNYEKKQSSTELIEQNLLMKALSDSIEKMPSEELKKAAQELGIENTNNLTPQACAAAFIAMFRAGGFKSYQITLIVVNAIWRFLFGHGLKLATNATITRTLSILTGPLGWTITGLWTAIDIASPAYRVTIPAVFQIIYLRSLNANRALIEEQTDNHQQ